MHPDESVSLVWITHGEDLSGKNVMAYMNSREVHDSGCEWCDNLKIRIMSRTGMRLNIGDKYGKGTVEKRS